MAAWVDFDEIKAQVGIEQVLSHYGLLDRMTVKGKKLSGLCPFHPDAKTKSFKADLEKNLWHCFGACGAGGDVIDLVCAQEGFTSGERNANRRKAAVLLQERFGITPKQGAPTPRQKPKKQAEAVSDPEHREGATATKEGKGCDQAAGKESEALFNPPLKFELKNLDPDHPYLFERGLTKETIVTFGLGFHTGKGSMQGRIAIPIHNERGELVAYAGRWPGEEGWPEDEDKYKLPSNFHKSLVLFNLHRAKEYAGEGLIVVEGFFAVFELWQKGRRNIVAVMGSHVSPEQEKLLVETIGPKGRVLIAFDQDEAGRKGSADAASRLAPHVYVRTIELSL